MLLTYLQAAMPLTKSYTKTKNGVGKTPYPFVWEFTSLKEDVTTLLQFKTSLMKHAALGHCILKGSIQKDLINESRKGSTDTNSTTEWIVLDLDGLPSPATIDNLLDQMGLGDISYIVQWSASYGITDKKIRAHVFMLLDKAYAAPAIKQYLIQKNHEVIMLRDAMTLTKTGNSISWPLDTSACQNDKLIYIAPPILKGIKDPMNGTSRITLVKRRVDHLSLKNKISTIEENKALTHARIAQLRDSEGLPKRKFTYKMVGGNEVLLKPDEASITEMKTERGFVYFNFNDGDSWAYYHPEDRPDYIYNFKSEPTYLTKELLPDYWNQLTQAGNIRTSSTGITYLAFCDRRTGVYWRGTYNQADDLLDINVAKNETQLRHFALQNGVPIGDFISEWDLVFDPHDGVRVDTVNKVINTFQPSIYMKAQAKRVTKCPHTIMKVIHHALGSDVDITEHFMNWVAYILQKRDKTKTAWVLHGTQGTGKGILTANILRPLFGAAHTATRRMEELNEQYNPWMAQTLMVFIDEVQVKALDNERGVMAKLKNFITEDIVPIRAMYANAIETRNYANIMMLSNMPDPVTIDRADRRHNIGAYQPNKLIITQAEIGRIESELQAFHDFLLCYVLDEAKAHDVIQSADRDTMISISESSMDTVANALIDGNFEFLVDHLPTDKSHERNAKTKNKVEEYSLVLRTLMLRTYPNGKCNIAREELRTIFDYVVGNISESPNKFTSLLKHHRVHTSKVWVDNKAVYGLPVQWLDFKAFPLYVAQHFAPPPKVKP